jgi:hypothetical protein
VTAKGVVLVDLRDRARVDVLVELVDQLLVFPDVGVEWLECALARKQPLPSVAMFIVSIGVPPARRISTCWKNSTQVETLMNSGVVAIPVSFWKCWKDFRTVAFDWAEPRIATVNWPLAF